MLTSAYCTGQPGTLSPGPFQQFNCVVNTVVSLLGAALAAFVASSAYHGKFDMVRLPEPSPCSSCIAPSFASPTVAGTHPVPGSHVAGTEAVPIFGALHSIQACVLHVRQKPWTSIGTLMLLAPDYHALDAFSAIRAQSLCNA